MPYHGLHDTRRACERSRICTQELRTGSDDAGRGNDARRGCLRTRLEAVTHLIDVADEQTAMRLRAAADPAGKDRLAAGSLDDHATDRADAVFARTVLLAERRWNPSGDLDELTAIHKGLFEGVFEDAGKLRTSNTTREVTNDRLEPRIPEAFFPAWAH